MKILVLGKGIANDGVKMLLEEDGYEFDYLNINEVKEYNYDLVIKAPGIPYDLELLQKFIQLKIKIITDVELAFTLRKKYYICVTGTNGKTTTVTLINDILKEKYKTVICGNIGYSICKALVENKDKEIFIVELSSFQLENTNIDPNISVILNVKPHHLDHHNTFKDYYESKANIVKNQSSNHLAIYNLCDPYINKMLKNSQAKKISFSNDSILAKCYTYKNNIYYGKRKIFKIDSNLLEKQHLLSDYLAAISVANQFKKINKKDIFRALKNFNGVEYRFTKINDYIYNDAKSTNPYSTIEALKSLNNVILICGGYYRGEDLHCLTDYLNRIKVVFSYGDTAIFVKNFMKNNNIDCYDFKTLEEATINALKLRKAEVILYSPMFASYDQFKNYNERGLLFNSIILNEKM